MESSIELVSSMFYPDRGKKLTAKQKTKAAKAAANCRWWPRRQRLTRNRLVDFVPKIRVTNFHYSTHVYVWLQIFRKYVFFCLAFLFFLW